MAHISNGIALSEEIVRVLGGSDTLGKLFVKQNRPEFHHLRNSSPIAGYPQIADGRFYTGSVLEHLVSEQTQPETC